MQFLLIIYDEEKLWAKLPEAERNAMFAEYGAFTESIKQSGQLRGGDALQPVSTARTVRVREGKTLTTHGPFAETREQLGGYYLVEAKDIEEACAIAARIPSARIGSVEVRPVMVFSE